MTLLSQPSFAQTSFRFVNQPSTASVLALGGQIATSTTYYPGSIYENPGLLSDSLKGEIAVGYSIIPAGVGMAHASFVAPSKLFGHLQISARRFGYGEIAGYDETGIYTGQFNAAENSFSVSTSFKANNYSMGLRLMYALSTIGNYSAHAMLVDLGGVFRHPDKDISVGLTLRNLGVVLSDFTSNSDSGTPSMVKLGTSFKPLHMPIRFSLTGYSFLDQGSSTVNNAEMGVEDKVASFMSVGAEFIWSENIQILMGFNFLERQELRLEGGAFGAGLSFGARFKTKGFTLEYGRANKHVGGSVNQLGLGFNIDKFVELK